MRGLWDFFYFAGRIGDCMLSSATADHSESPKRRKPFNLHKFLIQTKLIAVEIAATIVFLAWLYHEVMHELGR